MVRDMVKEWTFAVVLAVGSKNSQAQDACQRLLKRI